MQLSPHFSAEELSASQRAERSGIDNTPPATVVKNLKRLAAELEKVRALTGYPLRVLSGYRCPELNTAVGGVKNSYHLIGCAADFDPPPGMTHDALQHVIAGTKGIDFDKVIEERTKDGAHWLHFQIPRPGEKGRRTIFDAELGKLGGAIKRTTIG